MKNVLLTAIGSSSADIAIAELKNNGYYVIGCDIYPAEWVANALDVDVFYNAPRVSNPREYMDFVQDICIKEEINYIFPLTDVEVDFYNCHRDWFDKQGIKVCISSYETLSLCRNKKKIEEFLKDTDIVKTIPTQLLTDMSFAPEEYPVICKPFDGRSSEGLKCICSEEEWKEFLKQPNLDKYIVQPFVTGNIVTVDVVRQADGAKTVAIPRIELLRTQNGLGTSVYVFSDAALEQMCIRLADKLNVIGCVNFEFIKDENNTYHFLECNPRFSGGVKFSCMSGYSCIINHIKAFDNREIDCKTAVKPMYIARKYQEYITMIE